MHSTSGLIYVKDTYRSLPSYCSFFRRPQNLDRTGSNHRPDHRSDHGSDHGLDHGSDHEPKESIFWKIKKKRIVYN